MHGSHKLKILLLASAAVIIAMAAAAWLWVARAKPPPGMLKDIRAGITARHIADPDKRILQYLDARYGPMSDPVHRQEAFLDFFDVEHVKALQFLVQHSPRNNRQADIDAMSRWVENYGKSLSPQESASLSALFQTPEGQRMLRRATALYNSQDVRYRGSTAPVISQLLRTLHQIEQSQ
jgi:hypothetical protein